MDFVDFFEFLGEDLGMWDTFLPFILIFTIIFAILQKTKVLSGSNDDGGDAKKFNMVISAVVGFLVVIPHVTNSYPQGQDIVLIINSALPDVAAILVAIVLALIMANLFTQKEDGSSLFGESKWVPYVALAIVAYVFGSRAGWWDGFLPLSDATINLVIILLVFGLVFAFIWGKPNGGDQ
ncbi:MAG: hypothetical protein ACQESF_05170 [Nanobdellota archaeon]